MNGKKGFTLVEVLIVFVLFGVIASIITAGARLVVNKTANSSMTAAVFNLLKTGVGNYVADKGIILSGEELCTALKDDFNVIGSNCSAATNEFKTSAPNFVLRNGARFYNFGGELQADTTSNAQTARNLVAQIRTYETSKSELNPAAEDYLSSLNTINQEIKTRREQLAEISPFYIIYVDIDGERRNGTLDDDVVTFLVNMFGEVLPSGVAADDVKYLSAGYKYLRTQNGISSWYWAGNELSFRNAICKSGIQIQAKNYCTSVPKDALLCGQIPCRLVINK
ncbi:type II secretion system protein [bacterium]|nr:type II secretion system protein [bacterium]